MILQSKSSTSLPLDLAGISYECGVRTTLTRSRRKLLKAAADRSAAAMVIAVARNYEEEKETLYVDGDDEELDKSGHQRRRQGSLRGLTDPRGQARGPGFHHARARV